MSQHSLVTLLVVASLATVGLFGLAMVMAWQDRRAARQHALEHQWRLTTLRAYHRHAERQIDQISRAAIGHMLTLTQRDARGRGRP